MIIPKELHVDKQVIEFVAKSRESIKKIINKEDKRKLLVIGPCSIHDPEDALGFAEKLKILGDKVCDKFLVVMRVYFEKPRSVAGWKGFVNDPFLDDSCNIEEGIKLSHKLFVDILSIGVPVATEFLSPLVSVYFEDLVCYGSIGARTVESQIHRELASGLKMPVGFKNSTFGDVMVAVNAIKSASLPHNYVNINKEGVVSVIRSVGNFGPHLILRGGRYPNYDTESVKKASELLKENNLLESLVVDCSHGNSGKDPKKQIEVFEDVVKQFVVNRNVVGLMLESNLKFGNQKITNNLEKGVSVTDPCIDWETTEKLVLGAYAML